MQKIYVDSWLNNNQDGSMLTVDREKEIELDFSNVDEIKLADLLRILLIQKFAVFNQLKLKTQNMKPSISRIFKQTGISKIMNQATTNIATKKRQGLAVE